MSLVPVHSGSMYVNQRQTNDPLGGSLATVVTPVTGGPATFNGLAPSNLTELQRYSIAADFSTSSVAAWGATQWVDLGGAGTYTWNGTTWVAFTLAPAAPTNVVPVAGSLQATVSWTAPTVVGTKPISDYEVQVFNSAGAAATGVTGDLTRRAGTGTSYVFTGLTAGTGYKFKVVAISPAGSSAASTISAATATPTA